MCAKAGDYGETLPGSCDEPIPFRQLYGSEQLPTDLPVTCCCR
jgi:hypothetical protein